MRYYRIVPHGEVPSLYTILRLRWHMFWRRDTDQLFHTWEEAKEHITETLRGDVRNIPTAQHDVIYYGH